MANAKHRLVWPNFTTHLIPVAVRRLRLSPWKGKPIIAQDKRSRAPSWGKHPVPLASANSLAESVKLLCAGFSINDDVLLTDGDRPRGNCCPYRRCAEIRRGLQIEPDVVGWPRQYHVWSGRNECQLRLDENAEHRAAARTATTACRPVQRVAR